MGCYVLTTEYDDMGDLTMTEEDCQFRNLALHGDRINYLLLRAFDAEMEKIRALRLSLPELTKVESEMEAVIARGYIMAEKETDTTQQHKTLLLVQHWTHSLQGLRRFLATFGPLYVSTNATPTTFEEYCRFAAIERGNLLMQCRPPLHLQASWAGGDVQTQRLSPFRF